MILMMNKNNRFQNNKNNLKTKQKEMRLHELSPRPFTYALSNVRESLPTILFEANSQHALAHLYVTGSTVLLISVVYSIAFNNAQQMPLGTDECEPSADLECTKCAFQLDYGRLYSSLSNGPLVSLRIILLALQLSLPKQFLHNFVSSSCPKSSPEASG